jgi:hypothetical protein
MRRRFLSANILKHWHLIRNKAKGLSLAETVFAVKVSEKLVVEYKNLIEENVIDFDNVPF